MSAQLIEQLQTRGFDRSIDDEDDGVFVGCSQCQAIAINGVACHEHGCPNQTHECEECDAQISKRNRICESCANPPYDEQDEEY